MGSPIFELITKAYMQRLENFDPANDQTKNLYTLCERHIHHHLKSTNNLINCVLNNIKFTLEVETDKLSSLNTSITRTNMKKIDAHTYIYIYRKSVHTNRMLDYIPIT